jgi:nucleoside-diphosphate-sugar epimerase
MHSNKPVVFAGAHGRIGSRVLHYLKDAHPWYLVDLKPGPLEGLPVHVVDIMNLDQMLEAFAGSRAIVHSAIADYTGAGENAPEETKADYRRRMLDVNIKGTYNIYEAARLLNIPRVVYISSLTVALGPSARESKCSVKQAPDPVNFYACTKLFGEQIAKVYQTTYGVQTHVLRIGQPYYQDPARSPMEEKWLKNPFSASLLVTFHDIARAIDASLNSPGPDYGIYNVVSYHSSGLTDHSEGAEINFIPQDKMG